MCMHHCIRAAVSCSQRLIATPGAYYDTLPQVPQHAPMLSLPGYDLLLKSI